MVIAFISSGTASFAPPSAHPRTNTDAHLQNLGLGVLKELKPRQPGDPDSSGSEEEGEEQGEASDILSKLLNGGKHSKGLRGRPGIQEVEEVADTFMTDGGDVEMEMEKSPKEV